jgi:hypothetical protein
VSIITKVLKQTAVYWAPDGTDEYGQPTVASPVELDVRWEDTVEGVVNEEGSTVLSKSKVMVSADVAIGGMLWLGSLSDCPDPANPKNLSGAYEIIAFEKIPNFRCTEFMRIARL